VANMQLRHLRIPFSVSLDATRLAAVFGLQGSTPAIMAEIPGTALRTGRGSPGVTTPRDRVDFGDRAAAMAASAEVQE